MRALLIDPYRRKVSEIEIEGGFRAIQAALGCRMFDAVSISPATTDVIYLDEAGLSGSGRAFFALEGHPQPRYGGKGLVVGTVGDGEDAPAASSVEEIAAMVRWGGNDSPCGARLGG